MKEKKEKRVFKGLSTDAIERKCAETEEAKWGNWISPKKMTILMREFYPKERKKYVSAIHNALDHALRHSRKRKKKDPEDDT